MFFESNFFFLIAVPSIELFGFTFSDILRNGESLAGVEGYGPVYWFRRTHDHLLRRLYSCWLRRTFHHWFVVQPRTCLGDRGRYYRLCCLRQWCGGDARISPGDIPVYSGFCRH
ncbi:hypothetical protein PUN28_019198 [Cardiocondyla obscurior]|uniref:Secreted protein n=1 Tax=Cardiocondyla obscurior TaxID=286306 RepID=A0AAW2EAD2_9HYME